LDWKPGITAEEIKNRVLKNVNKGSIILFHNDTKHTAKILPEIITSLKQKGYGFIPVSQMIMRENYEIDYRGRQIKKTVTQVFCRQFASVIFILLHKIKRKVHYKITVYQKKWGLNRVLITAIVGQMTKKKLQMSLIPYYTIQRSEISIVDSKNLSGLDGKRLKSYLAELEKNNTDILILKLDLTDVSKEIYDYLRFDIIVFTDKADEINGEIEQNYMDLMKRAFSLLKEKV